MVALTACLMSAGLDKAAGRTRHRVSGWGSLCSHKDRDLSPPLDGLRPPHSTHSGDAPQCSFAIGPGRSLLPVAEVYDRRVGAHRAPQQKSEARPAPYLCSPPCRQTLSAAGFTLVETLVALTLLAVTLLGMAMVFPLETRLAALSNASSETGRLAQKELDQIRENISVAPGNFTDLDGNSVEVACPGSPGTSCGNPLTASGQIDFSQAAPVGFSGQLADPARGLYSVRWNISVTASNGKKIIVAAKAANLTAGLAPVVQFQTLTAP